MLTQDIWLRHHKYEVD